MYIWGTGGEISVDDFRKGTCFYEKERDIDVMICISVVPFTQFRLREANYPLLDFLC